MCGMKAKGFSRSQGAAGPLASWGCFLGSVISGFRMLRSAIAAPSEGEQVPRGPKLHASPHSAPLGVPSDVLFLSPLSLGDGEDPELWSADVPWTWLVGVLFSLPMSIRDAWGPPGTCQRQFWGCL